MQYRHLLDGLARLTLGRSTVDSVIAREGGVGLRRYCKLRRRSRRLRRECRADRACLDALHEVCQRHHAPVAAPLALISQIQRSGGSLLSQLFDGHPELHAHPHELKTGYPKKYLWPGIDLDDRPEHWFEVLFEENVIRDFREGYRKNPHDETTFPFLFLPSLQRRVFLQAFAARGAVRERDVFDAYMTSYFAAWLNNQNRGGEKKYVTAFTPRLAETEAGMAAFFAVYPDGRLISIVRDPSNWFPSASRHETKRNKYRDMTGALMQWNRNTRAMLRNKRVYGERVCILRFEDLINATESVMRHLAGFLGIAFDPILLTPTFNKAPIGANSSFRTERSGILTGTLSRYTTLRQEELETIDRMTADAYRAVLAEAVVP